MTDNNIQRYSIYHDGEVMLDFKNGSFVEYKDYLKAMAERIGKSNQLIIENEKTKSTIEAQAKEIQRLKKELESPSWKELDKWS